MKEQILLSLFFVFFFTLTRAQHQHDSRAQNTERVKDVMFGNFHAKIYVPRIELDREFELKVEIRDMKTHEPPESVRIFLNITSLHFPEDEKDGYEISVTKELDMIKPGVYSIREKLSYPGSYDLTVKLVDDWTGMEKEVIFEIGILKRKSFLHSIMDMHGTMMYGAIGVAIMIIMMAVKFIF